MPYTQQGFPFSGNAMEARHASWTGAKAAEIARAGKTKAYIALLTEHGPISDHAVSAMKGWPLASINSIRNAIECLVIADGFDTAVIGTRTTRRTRWRLRTLEERLAYEQAVLVAQVDVTTTHTESRPEEVEQMFERLTGKDANVKTAFIGILLVASLIAGCTAPNASPTSPTTATVATHAQPSVNDSGAMNAPRLECVAYHPPYGGNDVLPPAGGCFSTGRSREDIEVAISWRPQGTWGVSGRGIARAEQLPRRQLDYRRRSTTKRAVEIPQRTTAQIRCAALVTTCKPRPSNVKRKGWMTRGRRRDAPREMTESRR